MPMKKICLLILILFYALGINAQSYFLRHYSVEDGILSSEIYAQAQDTVGYIWFATSRGVSRFDGQTFVNYTVKDGLPTNSIITMFPDEQGNIWFAGYDGSLSYYHNGKIIPYRYFEKVKKLAHNYFINNLFVDHDFNLYIAPNFGGFYKIDSAGRVFNLDSLLPSSYRYVIVFIHGHPFFIKRKKVTAQNVFAFRVKDSVILLNIRVPALRRHIIKARNYYFLSLGKKLYRFNAHSFSNFKTFPDEISGLYLDQDQNLWVSILYNGVYVFRPPYDSAFIHLLDKKSPIRILQDNEGAYWLPTTESGIYYLPSFNFVNYDNLGLSQYNIISIAAHGNKIFFSTFNQQLFSGEIHNQKILSIKPLHLGPKNFTVNDILITDNGAWFLGKYLYHITPQGHKKLISQISRGYSLARGLNGNILATASYGFISACHDSVCYYFHDNRVPTSNSIYQSSDSTIWLGSINGLFSLKDSTLFFWGKKHHILKTRINHIAQYQNFILLATSGAGFIMLNTLDSSITTITDQTGLTTNFITNILVNDTTIWLGTNKGLTRLTIHSTSPLSYTIENFSPADGLFAEEIRDLAMASNTIFLATTHGLVAFSPNIKKKIPYPKLVVDSILIDNQRIPSTEKITIAPGQKNLTIYFKGISFRSGKNIVYRYKLKGLDDKWNITHNRYIRFSKLPAGHYSLYLTASAEKNHWNPNALVFQIDKKRRFIETPYFYLLLFIIATLIVSVISYAVIKHKREQIEHERQLILAEQKALRSQMNPHFIFNALNSIRRYILENDIDNADYYLTKFATLMRRVLDNSRQNFITLDNEIQTLQIYLELEKMRFDNSFTFDIKVDPQINTSTWIIPPMLIQPFVENAIWHGLALKQRDGRLNIKFIQTDKNKIQCFIDDNGIGREKAKEIAQRRKGHKSTGLVNIQERIKLINKLYHKNIQMQITDKYSPDNRPAGTTVIITFPNFDISS